MCNGCLDGVDGGWGFSRVAPPMRCGLIRDGSGESRVGGGDVRGSRDTLLPST